MVRGITTILAAVALLGTGCRDWHLDTGGRLWGPSDFADAIKQLGPIWPAVLPMLTAEMQGRIIADPGDWRAVVGKSGHVLVYNVRTGDSHWTAPPGLPGAHESVSFTLPPLARRGPREE